MKAEELLSNVARFWAKVDRTGDCWVWTAEKNRFGYGRFEFWHQGGRTRVLAHRMVLLLVGRDLPEDLKVLHVCDNPPCVNPDHLEVGTQAENIRDAHKKGRLNLDGLQLGTAARWERDRPKKNKQQPNPEGTAA